MLVKIISDMERETLRVTWKIIRRAGYGRTPSTYCRYIAENEKHSHKLKTVEGTELFELLQQHVVSKHEYGAIKIYIDGVYRNGELQYVTNFRAI